MEGAHLYFAKETVWAGPSMAAAAATLFSDVYIPRGVRCSIDKKLIIRGSIYCLPIFLSLSDRPKLFLVF